MLVVNIMLYTAIGIFVMILMNSFKCIWDGNFDTTTWTTLYNIVVPFDTTTIVGWYFFYIVQCYLACTYCYNQPTVITFFMGCCLYVETLCKHFKCLIHKSQIDFKNEVPTINNSSKKRKIESQVKRNLIQAVQLHMKTIKYFSILLIAIKLADLLVLSNFQDFSFSR